MIKAGIVLLLLAGFINPLVGAAESCCSEPSNNNEISEQKTPLPNPETEKVAEYLGK